MTTGKEKAQKTEEEKVLALFKRLFGENKDLKPSSTASSLEYDVRRNPRTQNAALFDSEMAAIGAVEETLKRVLKALENGENLLED